MWGLSWLRGSPVITGFFLPNDVGSIDMPNAHLYFQISSPFCSHERIDIMWVVLGME